jgi:GNAT superfamily N-acetyltransferase
LANDILISDVDDGLDDILGQELYDYNVAVTSLSDGRLLRITVRDEKGALLGGLSGWTWGGAGFIDRFWIREEHRGKGWGRRILESAEQEMRRRGCDRVALCTHTFQAPGFYTQAGYVECGRFRGYPNGHDQIHMLKQFA